MLMGAIVMFGGCISEPVDEPVDVTQTTTKNPLPDTSVRYTVIDTADAKLTEAMGYFSASMDLADQERFDAADAKLDEAVTAISMAEANIDDAKDMGAPKEETDEYDAYISYTKSWIPIVRSTNNIDKFLKELDEKGYSEEINQKMITETDKMLTNLQNAEITGLKIMGNYPTIASEFKIAKDIEDIRSLEKDYQDVKNVLLTTTYTVTTPTPTPTIPIPDWYYDSGCDIPVGTSLIEWLTEYEWANEYVRGNWDCSQMSAALEWHLENCGYDTLIQGGTLRGGGHAWVLIWLPKGTEIETPTGRMRAPKEGYYLYEATSRYFPMDTSDYVVTYTYRDIYDVWEIKKKACGIETGLCGEEHFLNEYGWWE